MALCGPCPHIPSCHNRPACFSPTQAGQRANLSRSLPGPAHRQPMTAGLDAAAHTSHTGSLLLTPYPHTHAQTRPFSINRRIRCTFRECRVRRRRHLRAGLGRRSVTYLQVPQQSELKGEMSQLGEHMSRISTSASLGCSDVTELKSPQVSLILLLAPRSRSSQGLLHLFLHFRELRTRKGTDGTGVSSGWATDATSGTCKCTANYCCTRRASRCSKFSIA